MDCQQQRIIESKLDVLKSLSYCFLSTEKILFHMEITFLFCPVKHLMCIWVYSLHTGWQCDKLGFSVIPQGFKLNLHTFNAFCLSDPIWWDSSLFQMLLQQYWKFSPWVNSFSPSSEKISTSSIWELEGDSWFLHQVTQNAVQLLVFSGLETPLRNLLKRLRRVFGHQIDFRGQYFDDLIISK